MGIEGKVAKVLNSRELVFNKGASDGVETGMKFHVQGMIDIVDPDSQEDLGSLARSKLEVEVVEVEPRFAIARSFETYEAIPGLTATVEKLRAASGVRRPRRILSIPDDEYREDSVSVSIGDPVVQVAR